MYLEIAQTKQQKRQLEALCAARVKDLPRLVSFFLAVVAVFFGMQNRRKVSTSSEHGRWQSTIAMFPVDAVNK